MNPVTPMRQIPGAYFNTPAPGANTGVRRRLNFNEPAGAGVTAGLGATGGPFNSQAVPPAVIPGVGTGSGLLPLPQGREELDPVAKAALSINKTLQLDESFPDLDSYCRPGASSEYDIQLPDSPWAPFNKAQMYPIPEQIFAQLNQGEVHTKLGLFADIGYAWASIDSSLFIWDYTHPTPELIGYEDATHTITAVALVPPKPGVFINTITHILVVATTTEIVLLGLSAVPTPGGANQVSLYQTKMSIHRGGSDVSIIVGTASGRIFFGGESDTDISELSYQQEERWFSSRCGKVNHTHPGWTSVVPSLPAPIFGSRQHEHLTSLVVDNTRNLLYSLSSNSTIRTYHMETPEKLTKVIDKEKNSCLRDITHMIDRSPLLNDRMSIVALSPITATEASKLHLMALTDTGCRLFLSATSSASYIMGAATSLAPQSMQVQFVKFPPKEPTRARGVDGQIAEAGLDLTSRALEISAFGHRFAPGYFFDVVRKAAEEDMLFISTPDTGKIKATTPASALKYFEQGGWVELGPMTTALAIGLTTSPFSAARQPLGFGNELAVQFDHAPSEFAVLTNSGVHVIRRRRLVDIFATAIRTASGDEGLERELRKFINQYGRVETISAALAVACGQGSDLRTGTSRAPDQGTEDRARTAFVDFGGQPRLAETDGNQITADSVRLSSRHDALALYLTRLIRVLWKSKVVNIRIDKTGAAAVSPTVPTSKLTTVQENVERLRNFLEANKGIIQGLAGPSDRVSSRQEEIALQKEHQALHSLRKLMESVSEGISFVIMLFDERVTDIFARLDDTSRQQLKDLTYENLFSQAPGKELAKVLVKAIVNRNIASGSNVETVADALRRRCGSFCSPDDVVIFKAQEQLQRATEQVNNTNILRTLLAESLRLFEQVAGSLSSANLQGAVEQYVALKYYAGAIQLCLVVAREKDRGNSALSWVNEGKPQNDPREKSFKAREGCYRLIHEVLDRLEAVSALEPEKVDGRLTLTATKRLEAYNVVNSSDDEVFHFNLYDWYIQKNWTDRILAIDSPHVITYLERLAATDPEHADLLCRFYTHRSRFFEAAKVQADLAKSEFNISIKDRITLLSRAKGNASVNTIGIGRQQQQELNHEVTELLEVAHIQDDLLERLRADPRIHEQRLSEVEQTLDGPIQGLSELFNSYADQAGYYDLCLLIFNAANFQNPRIINETWENLINDTHHDIDQRQQIWQAFQEGQLLPDGIPPPTGEPPMPYESVSSQIQNIAHRTSLDSLIFPVDHLVPLVCAYAINNGQDATIGADPSWPVLLFLNLGVPYALIVHMLEEIFDTQEQPFLGRKRKLVVQWINTAVEAWIREVERRGTAGKGGDGAISGWVSDLLVRAEECLVQLSAGGRANADAEEIVETRRTVRSLKRMVDQIAGADRQGSLFGR
ncbi:Non-repetitive/WGA-negative nucleoporin C-terminal-domain-containing protein [Lasiosphaeria hispida]|uniref:Non-repetitive/WGA-negative nucleoporin C-terminal-domain-containing protein n=1 Tax=Lasiosphaeria hispida TaxID=260671 RepID=A0AAJ0HH54_9PEZI|nr:Non-repetitive/WGA-negative nucleoporin C-terminal-domain-containing protein [Lasiosphaeria hispida]